jgi:hypothetical protein
VKYALSISEWVNCPFTNDGSDKCSAGSERGYYSELHLFSHIHWFKNERIQLFLNRDNYPDVVLRADETAIKVSTANKAASHLHRR